MFILKATLITWYLDLIAFKYLDVINYWHCILEDFGFCFVFYNG